LHLVGHFYKIWFVEGLFLALTQGPYWSCNYKIRPFWWICCALFLDFFPHFVWVQFSLGQTSSTLCATINFNITLHNIGLPTCCLPSKFLYGQTGIFIWNAPRNDNYAKNFENSPRPPVLSRTQSATSNPLTTWNITRALDIDRCSEKALPCLGKATEGSWTFTAIYGSETGAHVSHHIVLRTDFRPYSFYGKYSRPPLPLPIEKCWKLSWEYISDMRRLTTAILSEKCVVRRFRRCANVYLHWPR